MKFVKIIKGIFFCVAVVGCANFVMASDKVSNSLRMEMVKRTVSSKKIMAAESDSIGVLISADDAKSVADFLRAKGVSIGFETSGIIVCRLPVGLIAELTKLDEVRKIDIPRRVMPLMNLARKAMNVDAVHQGVKIHDDVIPYTGKGVIVGIVDCGIQPAHKAFYDSDLTGTRIKRYVMTESSHESESEELIVDIYDTWNDIINAPADNSVGGHGTHVAGIAAGTDIGNDYYGVALEADLVLSSVGKEIYDDEILAGIKSAVEYADDKGMPLVVNLSLGSAIGPHDGTGYVSDYLSEIADEGRIVCFAAGNDGSIRISLMQDFSVDASPLSSLFARKNYGTPPQKIYSQLWSSDEKEFEIAFQVTDITTREVLYSSPYTSSRLSGGLTDEVVVLLDSENPNDSMFPELDKYFSGNILFATGVEESNGRYVSEIYGDFENVDENTPYTLGISIKSEDGAEVMAIADFSCCFFRGFGIDGFVNGNPEHSISDYCTSPHVVSVGSWNSRETWTDVDGEQHFLNGDSYGVCGGIALYSSYGINLSTGERLPHVVAPGTEIISSLNSEAEDLDKATFVCLEQSIDGVTYQYGNMTGTSMASPAATGVIALWLEADPTLTRDRIIDVLSKSCIRDDAVVADSKKAGYGKIDAYAGLKYILTGESGISEVAADRDLKMMMRYLSDDAVEIVLSEKVETGECCICDLQGRQLLVQSVSGNLIELPLNLASGYYIICLNTNKGTAIQKVMIR